MSAHEKTEAIPVQPDLRVVDAGEAVVRSASEKLLGVSDEVGPTPSPTKRRRHRRPEPKSPLEAMAAVEVKPVPEGADPFDVDGWDTELEKVGAAWAAEYRERNGQAS